MAAFPGQWASGALLASPHPLLADVLGIWRHAIGGRKMAPHNALGPAQLKPVLPDVHIYNVSPEPPRFTVRLTGTRISEYLGTRITGRPVEEIAPERTRRAIVSILGVIDQTHEPLHLKAPRAVALPNGDERTLESLWLPCCSGDGATLERVVAVSLIGD